MEILKVAAKSDPAKVAGAIASGIEKDGIAELNSIGAAAGNQTTKAIAIARGIMAPKGYNLVCEPGFTTIVIDGVERTGMRHIVRVW